MKRLILAVTIIIVIFVFSFFGSNYVNVTLDEIIFTAETEPENVEELWENKRKLLSVFLCNGDIDSIEELIYSNGDIKELESVVKNIKNGEKFNLENIL